MSPGGFFDLLTPHARVATAVAPFVVAMALRLLMGKNRFTGAFLSLATMWFAINVLLTPYSAQMRHDLLSLRWPFR